MQVVMLMRTNAKMSQQMDKLEVFAFNSSLVLDIGLDAA